MTDLLTDLDRDLVNIQALVRDSMQQDPPASASIESDSQWEMVDSPEELKKPPQSLADFMADVIADQEEALGLSPEYPQVLLKLVQLIARTDEYRGRLSSNDLEKHECLKDGLTHLEEAGDRVRRFIEGADLEDGEPMILEDHPIGLTRSWGEVDLGMEALGGDTTKELELTIEDFVMAMGFFWDAVDNALWRR
eukprot:TRINITY_DN900_c0_g1_i2.p1 TRINITY_DN900_c0_g1~~TRINITY_DN900_c0_g1_i2.p1  ORF type:complete len:194 (+),score=39.38 TRINITY_DN900_c0_g1_i2:233-814(+)